MDISKLYNIEGKVALVTGGGSGIGAMATEALVRAGCKVYIASRRLDSCLAIADELNAIGPGRVIALSADLSTGEGTEELANHLKSVELELHILLNNSGMTWGAPFEEFPRQKWDDVLRLNVTAVADLTRLLHPMLKKAGKADDPARVINLGSVAGTRTVSNMAYSYGASKAAVHHITKILSHELAVDHITVNAIAPGPFPSRMMAHITEDEKRRKAMESVVPLRRVGTGEDIAGVLLMLTSRAGSYITGGIIPLDGGMSALP
ncbi:SDR family oxidoreductase [Kordiimonas sp. SCSIO 12603]|uniref:SDR family oxidoreductase n=1 Tax=Kordiimonas sp. SCSIO 12603 TaxID=2829596 RepID=UPI002104E5AD|nr:SDR family oxidoreductase [Kordiimonas sp. SCSIO 12603]UTW57209.1 SDR family oxidoreductase [Kordiimonas sp. SCSIO 12603]